MYDRKRVRPYRKAYMIALTVSLVALFAPERWFAGLISLVQVVVPFQHAATAVADSINPPEIDRTNDPAVSGEAYRTLERQRAALEHQVAALATRISELEGEVGILAATRLWEVAGRRIGTMGRLVPASVITEDLLPWRASRLINAGKLQGVRPGAAVVSHHFTIDQGQSAGVQSGMAVLLRETLVGFVAQVGTHTARVKLLSDRSVRMKVRIGRFHSDGFAPQDRYFWLTGQGNGRMLIRDVSRREVSAGKVQVNDVVLSDPAGDTLPAAMTLGRITRIDLDHENPLLSVLTVESSLNEAGLRRVYVFEPDTSADPG